MKQLTQTLTSLEVAEMVEKEHSKLLRDIRRYIGQLGEAKIGFTDFFTESTYQTEQGKELPCYNITKKGCEFIAHKMTGTKGTAFTARYINKFHSMEQSITQSQQPRLSTKETYLLQYQKTWFERNNWRMKEICKHYNWERKYLYHKILTELSDIYNLTAIERMYINTNGYRPQYKMELLEYFQPLQITADRYLDFLYRETEE